MQPKRAWSLFYAPKYLRTKQNDAGRLNVLFYHQLQEPNEDPMPVTYESAISKLTELNHVLKNVDLINGKLVTVGKNSTITVDCIEHKIKMFKSLARAFIGSPSVQQALEKKKAVASSANGFIPKASFSQPNEREPMTLNTLTKVCNYLDISAQQRKSVRFNICPQVTQHRIWTGTLQVILKDLKSDIGSLNHQSLTGGLKLSEQIMSRCLRFLDETTISSNPESISWMRLTPTKKFGSPPSRQWEEMLDLFIDLIKCLSNEKGLSYHISKLEIMKEGLYQIKDVLVDRDIGYKEARHQENLVQKKLTKTLGHSSQCLFTLLQYYLYGSVRDPEVELCGGVFEGSEKGRLCLCIGKVLTSDDEKMLGIGVKQLDKALGLFKFVWEAAGMEKALELQGHLWCFGAVDRILTYRGGLEALLKPTVPLPMSIQ